MGLEAFDDESEVVKPGGKGSLKDLPDGDYEFVIDKAEIRDGKSGTIFGMKLTVLSEGIASGREVEAPYFLTTFDKEAKQLKLNDTSVGILKKDLMTLGFDADQWTKTNSRPFSKELEKAAFAMNGVKFKGKKVTNDKYANLYINERAQDDAPRTFGPDELAKAHKKANEIPF